jgi:hypothetical protein
MSLAVVATSQELCLGDQSHLLACIAQFHRGTGVDFSEYLLCSGRYVAIRIRGRTYAKLGAIGQYSVTAKVTVVVTAACSTVAAMLFLLYNTVMLKLVKRRHEREIRDAGRWEDEGSSPEAEHRV